MTEPTKAEVKERLAEYETTRKATTLLLLSTFPTEFIEKAEPFLMEKSVEIFKAAGAEPRLAEFLAGLSALGMLFLIEGRMNLVAELREKFKPAGKS